jgi:hypothetical protein
MNDLYINSDDIFKNYLYKYICQCYEQCIGLSKLNFENLNKTPQSICTQIIAGEKIDYLGLIENSLKYFSSIKKLKQFSNKRYYIILPDDSRLRLTWENIKTLKDEEIELFWLLRKLVIDSILKFLLHENNYLEKDIQIYSVGSNKLTSDYDITLYGDNDKKTKILYQFQEIFTKYFKEDSSIVFDTNIYGKAYISFNKNEFGEFSNEHINCGQTFYYLSETSSPDSQLMWGLIKYMRDFRDNFGEYMYNDLKNFMDKKIVGFTLLNYTHESLIYLKNRSYEDVNYKSLFGKEKRFMEDIYYKDEKLIGLHDYISLINFYGSETYFTRGAFIDVVVNSQMCANKSKIKLNEIDYITSILENAGFFFTHNNKTKYILRVLKTLDILTNDFKKYKKIRSKYKNLKSFLDKFKDESNEYDKNYCHDWANVKKDEIDIEKCQKYKIFNMIINIVYKILKIYNKNHKGDYNILFYDSYVQKHITVTSPLRIQMAPSITNLAYYS